MTRFIVFQRQVHYGNLDADELFVGAYESMPYLGQSYPNDTLDAFDVVDNIWLLDVAKTKPEPAK